MDIKVYGVHVTQENTLGDVMNQEFIQTVKRHGAIFVRQCKDPVRYLASFVLPTREKQRAFSADLKKMGIKAHDDALPATMPESYIGQYVDKDWLAE